MSHTKKVIQYYEDTENDYKIMWHHKLEGPPALHFGYYDDKARNHAQALYRMNQVMAELASIKPGEKVLDAGCGLGHSAIWLEKKCEAIVTGISITQQQIDGCNEYAKSESAKNVNFICSDYLHTPFEDNSFDVIWCLESVCHALDKSLFYKEAFRLLKPGGRLVMSDSFRGGRPLSASNEKLLKSAFIGWEIHDVDTPEEHTTNALNAGFKKVKINDVSERVMISYKNVREHTRNLLWLAYLCNFLGIINKVRLNNVKSSHHQFEALQKKAFKYMHLLAEK